jgi:signal transduction histidine kinase/Tfp pilus assembly protein PilF
MKCKKLIIGPKSIVLTLCFLLTGFSVFSQGSVSQQLTTIQATKNDSVKIDLYRQIFDHFQYSKSDSVTDCLQRGLLRFSDENNRLGIASLTSMLAFLDVHHGRIEMARKRQTSALKIFEEINNKRGIASANNGLGIVDGKTGNFDGAIKHFLVALRTFQADSNTAGIINTYMNLGVINQINNNLDKALEYYNKALSYVTDTTDVRSTCNLYNNIGIVYGKKGDAGKSIEYFEKSLKRSEKPEYIDQQASALLNKGIAYHIFGDDTKALEQYNKALEITKDKNFPEEQARILVNISSITTKTNPEKAIAELKDALDTARKIGQKALIEEIYANLVENYKKTGKYKDAVVLMEEQRDMEDSLFSVEKAAEIANLESVYELDESNATIKELKFIQQKDSLKRNIAVVVAVILIITLVIILSYLQKTRKLNEKLSKREAELDKSNKIKDKLFSIIGHDLRGPIGNIPMMMQIMEDESTSPAERKYLFDVLMEHIQASTETLDKLLYWGNSQIKGTGIRQETFNFTDNIQENVSLVKSSATQKKITIINNADTGLKIYGDPTYFDFIFRNLLSNAIKFTRENGTVEIATDTHKLSGFTIFSIKDNGIGIDEERLQQIFEPFMMSTKGTADEPGTSIGLMLCKEFVTANGGQIWVESEVDKGSTFYFTFKNG